MSSTTLAETVASAIRDSILHGNYLSGERLVEISLAHEMNVSQNTVRDALSVLEQEGWVVKRARRGVYVRTFSADEAAEVYALLSAVEPLALEWAIRLITKTQLAELRRLLSQARKLSHSGDRPAALEALFRFHEMLGTIAAKPLTGELLVRLYNCARLLEAVRQARAPRFAHNLEARIDLHDTLLDYIERGDKIAAVETFHAQLSAYRDILLPALAGGG
jgi:DNA-binding GntR family transcriptional regulator